MHKKLLIISGTALASLLCGILLGAAGLWFCLKQNFIMEQECILPYEQTVSGFIIRAKKLNWSIRTLPCGLPAMIPGQRITVLEICSREYANRILNVPASRKAASILPCKVAIYEKDNKVWISRLNGRLAALLLGGIFEQVFMTHVLPEQAMMLHDLIQHTAENTASSTKSPVHHQK